MVVMRLGVGFVPLMRVREERARGELSVLALDGFHQERSLYMVRRRAAQSHSALAFAKVAVAFGEDLKSGKYKVRMAMLDPHTGKAAVQFAIQGRQSDGWYELGEIEVQ